jgi:Domain of unknown function (DUF1648)/Bacterial PH domain
VLLFLGLAALVLGGSREPGPAMLVLCVLAALLGLGGAMLLILALGYRRLAYELTDSALRIEWLGRTMVVPYEAIHGIYTGQRLEGHAMPSTPRWPGISIGSARVRGFGRLRFYATSTDQSALTLITVERGGVILSAHDPSAFRSALIEHVERHQDAAVTEEVVAWHQTPARTAPWTALLDVWLPASVLVSTLLVLLVLTAIIVRFEALPDQIPLHYDSSGQPNLIGPKFDLLRLPFLGLVVLVLNVGLGVVAHPREPLLARLLWVSAAAVELVLLVGVLRLVA